MTAVGAGDRTPGAVRVLVIVLCVFDAVVGVWALFFPRAFYDGFPGLSLHWISPLGPYSAHLVTDVGGAYLALLALLALAVRSGHRSTIRIALVVSLVQAVPHLIWHATHLEMFAALDAVTLVVALALAVVLPAVALALTWRRPHRAGVDDR